MYLPSDNTFEFDEAPVALYGKAKPQNKILLRPYQMDAIASYHGALGDGKKRGLIVLPTGSGKEQPLFEPVLTPLGWSQMGKLSVGDFVIGSDGKPTEVIGVYPQGNKKIWTVGFSDETFVRCGADHLWTVTTRYDKHDVLRGQKKSSPWRTVKTKDLRPDRFFQLPPTTAVEFRQANLLPVDPYLLGLLIGDGGLTNGMIRFSTVDVEILDRINQALRYDGVIVKCSGDNCDYVIKSPKLRYALNILGLMGKYSYDKRVPREYLYASVGDRISLLRGLMDTDGTVSVEGSAEFCTTSPWLANDFLNLVRSLGGVSKIRDKKNTFYYDKDRNRVDCRDAYRISANIDNVQVFSLERKKQRYQVRPKRANGFKLIDTVVESDQYVEQVCISVAASDGLYVTSGYALTHNTVVFGSLGNNKKTLILAHRDNLCAQAVKTMKALHPHLRIGLEKAEFSAGPADDIIIGSVQTLGRAPKENEEGETATASPRLSRWNIDTFGTVIVDEAHHAVGNSYLRILKHLGAGKPDGPFLLGVTATANRGDGKQLADLFEHPLFLMDMPPLIDQGYLCNLRTKRTYSGVDISDLANTSEDFNEKKLAAKVNIDARNSLIVSAIEDHAADRKCILVFAVDIDHAETLAGHFRGRGHDAECVHYKVNDGERTDIMQRFANGDLRILVNVAILTEGFDNPRIDCLALARPTKSPLLYTQMLGRGTRQACPNCWATDFEVFLDSQKNTNWKCKQCLNVWDVSEAKYCKVIDFVDLAGKLEIESAASAFGIPEIDLLDEPITTAIKVVKEARELGIHIDDKTDTVATVEKKVDTVRKLLRGTIYIQTVAEAVDVFNATKRVESEEHSRFPWMKRGKDKFLIHTMGGKRIGLWRDAFGQWNVAHGTNTLNIGTKSSVPWKAADKAVKSFLKEKIKVSDDYSVPEWKFITNDAAWRRKKATDSQKRVLKSLGIKEFPPELTKGEAADKITWFKMARKK